MRYASDLDSCLRPRRLQCGGLELEPAANQSSGSGGQHWRYPARDPVGTHHVQLTVTLRGRIEPYTPTFNGAVLEWRPVGGEWTRIAANEDATGLFEANLGGLSPGGDYVCRAWMGVARSTFGGRNTGSRCPCRPRTSGAPTPPPATTMPRPPSTTARANTPNGSGRTATAMGLAMPMPRAPSNVRLCPVRLCPQRPGLQ